MKKLTGALLMVVALTLCSGPNVFAQQSPGYLTGSLSVKSGSPGFIQGLSGQTTCQVNVTGTWTGSITVATAIANGQSATLTDEIGGGTTVTTNGVYAYNSFSGSVLTFTGTSTGQANLTYACSVANSSGSFVTITGTPTVSIGVPTVIPSCPAASYPCGIPTPLATVFIANTPGTTVQNAPTVVPSCPAAAYPCGLPTPTPYPQPTPIYTSPVSCAAAANCPVNATQVTSPWVVTTINPSLPAPQATFPVSCTAAANCPVNATQVTSPWVVSTPSAGPLPTASAGAALPGSAPAVTAYWACALAAGAAPTVSAGNAILAQCDATGRLIVNPQPQATIQVNTPAPLPTAATYLFPYLVLACPSTAPAAVNSTYVATCDSTGHQNVNVVNSPVPLPTASSGQAPLSILVGPSTAPAVVNNAYQAVVDSVGNQTVKFCASTAAQCVNPTASPNAASTLNKVPTALCANNAGTDNCAAVNASQQLSVLQGNAPQAFPTASPGPCQFGINSTGCAIPVLCTLNASADITSATTATIIPHVTGKKTYICGMTISGVTVSATTFVLKSGTQTTTACDTGAVQLSGGFDLPTTTGGQLVLGYGLGLIGTPAAASQDVCVTSTGTFTDVRMNLQYEQF